MQQDHRTRRSCVGEESVCVCVSGRGCGNLCVGEGAKGGG